MWKTRYKKTLTEIKNVFDGLISRMDTVEERISELEYMSTEKSKMKDKDKKIEKNEMEYPRSVG